MALWNIWKIFFVVFVKVDYLYSYFTDSDIITYIEEHNMSCLSCENRCGESSVNTSIACSCDTDCMFYGDCCPDYIKHCSDKDENKGILYHKGPDMTCKSVGNNSTLMVSVRACLTETIVSDDYLSTPVYYNSTGIYYIHMECAVCNELKAENVIYHQVEQNNNVTYERKDGNKIDRTDTGRQNNTINNMRYTKLRWCLPKTDVTETCPDSTNETTNEKCVKGHRQYVYLGHLYKNFHCLLCNGYVDKHISFSCPDFKSKNRLRDVLYYYFSGVGLTLA